MSPDLGKENTETQLARSFDFNLPLEYPWLYRLGVSVGRQDGVYSSLVSEHPGSLTGSLRPLRLSNDSLEVQNARWLVREAGS